MQKLSRKQREIQDREELILDTARRLLLQNGFNGTTMDAIAKEIEYSKGTVYQHFASKEDLVCALSVRTMRRLVEKFERAATFRGRARERMCAVGAAYEYFFRLNPEDLFIQGMIKGSEVAEKVEQAKQNELMACDDRNFQICAGIARDAIAQGDLELPTRESVESMTFGLWALTFGSFSIYELFGDDLEHRRGIRKPFQVVRRNCHYLMDGYGWKPLFREWDYEHTYERIDTEVFPDESKKLER